MRSLLPRYETARPQLDRGLRRDGRHRPYATVVRRFHMGSHRRTRHRHPLGRSAGFPLRMECRPAPAAGYERADDRGGDRRVDHRRARRGRGRRIPFRPLRVARKFGRRTRAQRHSLTHVARTRDRPAPQSRRRHRGSPCQGCGRGRHHPDPQWPAHPARWCRLRW